MAGRKRLARPTVALQVRIPADLHDWLKASGDPRRRLIEILEASRSGVIEITDEVRAQVLEVWLKETE